MPKKLMLRFAPSREREREREIHFFQFGFVFVNAGSRINVMFLDSSYTALHHIALSSASSFFIQICSMCSPFVFSTSYSIAHALFFRPLQNLTLFSKYHHYPFSKHAHIIVLHLPWLVHLKYPLNPANS